MRIRALTRARPIPSWKRERLGQRPPVLERVEAAGRQPCAVGDTAGCTARQPRAVALSVVEGGNRRTRELASPRLAQRTPVPRGPYNHLWQPDANASQPQAPCRLGLGSHAVHPVDADEHPVGQRVRDLGAAEASRPCSNAPTSGRRRVSVAVTARRSLVTISSTEALRGSSYSAHAPDARRRIQPECLVRGVEVVLGRQDLVLDLQGEPRVEQAEPHRRRVGERDVGRRGTRGSGRCGTQRFAPSGLASLRVQVARPGWRRAGARWRSIASRTGRGCDREEERRQVDSATGQRELGAHRPPVGQVRRGLDYARPSPARRRRSTTPTRASSPRRVSSAMWTGTPHLRVSCAD